MPIAQITMLAPAEGLPLFGRRVLVTAPRTYALRFAQAILSAGGLPVLMPTIETTLCADYTELDRCLHERATFDWIAFTSRNGIEALLHRCEQLGLPPTALNDCRLAAIGKDAERLVELGLRVDLVPQEASPRGIVEAMQKAKGRRQNLEDQASSNENPPPPLSARPTGAGGGEVRAASGPSILVPAPAVTGIPEPDIIPTFVADLERIGMRVTRVPAYTTRLLDRGRYEVELALIRQGAVDVVAFSSAAEVAGFLAMVDGPEDYRRCVIACFGPYTAANAQRMGLPPAVVAEDFSAFAGFARALAAFFG